MITAKINVSLIDKSRLFKGDKGMYLDLVLIDTPNGKFGDFMVKQSVSKEERESGVELPILGNAKIMARHTQKPNPTPELPNNEVQDDSDVPF